MPHSVFTAKHDKELTSKLRRPDEADAASALGPLADAVERAIANERPEGYMVHVEGLSKLSGWQALKDHGHLRDAKTADEAYTALAEKGAKGIRVADDLMGLTLRISSQTKPEKTILGTQVRAIAKAATERVSYGEKVGWTVEEARSVSSWCQSLCEGKQKQEQGVAFGQIVSFRFVALRAWQDDPINAVPPQLRPFTPLFHQMTKQDFDALTKSTEEQVKTRAIQRRAAGKYAANIRKNLITIPETQPPPSVPSETSSQEADAALLFIEHGTGPLKVLVYCVLKPFEPPMTMPKLVVPSSQGSFVSINWARGGHDDPIDAMISGSGYWRGIFCRFAERFAEAPPPHPSRKLISTAPPPLQGPAGREATAVCVAPL